MFAFWTHLNQSEDDDDDNVNQPSNTEQSQHEPAPINPHRHRHNSHDDDDDHQASDDKIHNEPGTTSPHQSASTEREHHSHADSQRIPPNDRNQQERNINTASPPHLPAASYHRTDNNDVNELNPMHQHTKTNSDDDSNQHNTTTNLQTVQKERQSHAASNAQSNQRNNTKIRKSRKRKLCEVQNGIGPIDECTLQPKKARCTSNKIQQRLTSDTEDDAVVQDIVIDQNAAPRTANDEKREEDESNCSDPNVQGWKCAECNWIQKFASGKWSDYKLRPFVYRFVCANCRDQMEQAIKDQKDKKIKKQILERHTITFLCLYNGCKDNRNAKKWTGKNAFINWRNHYMRHHPESQRLHLSFFH